MFAAPPRPRPRRAHREGGDAPIPVFLNTDLGTHLALLVPPDTGIRSLKSQVAAEHAAAFPDLGPVTVKSFQVRRKRVLYHLCDSMTVMSVFKKIKGGCFLHVNMAEAIAATHCCQDAPATDDKRVRDVCLGIHDTLHEESIQLENPSTVGKKKKRKRCRLSPSKSASAQETTEPSATAVDLLKPTGEVLPHNSLGMQIHNIHAMDNLSQEKEHKKSRTSSADTSSRHLLETDPTSLREPLNTSNHQVHDTLHQESIQLENPSAAGKKKKKKKKHQLASSKSASAQITTEPSSTAAPGDLSKSTGDEAYNVELTGKDETIVKTSGLPLSSSELNDRNQRGKSVQFVGNAQASSDLISEQEKFDHALKGCRDPPIEDAIYYTGENVAIEGKTMKGSCAPLDGWDKHEEIKQHNEGYYNEGVPETSNMEKDGKSTYVSDKRQTDQNTSQEKKRKKSKVGSVDMPSVDATGEKDHGYSENAAKQDTVSTKREIGHEPSMQQMSNIVYQGDANVIENPSGDGKKKKKRRCHSESLKAMNPSQDLTKSSGFVTNESSIHCIDATPIDAKQTTPGIIEGETVTEHKKLSETLDVAATNVVDEVLADLISKDSLSKDLDEDLLPGQTHLGSNQNGVEVPESNAVKVGSITAALPPKYPAAVHPASPVSSPGQKKSKGKKSKVLPTMTDSSHQSGGVPEDANRELKDSDSFRFADKTSDPEDIVTGNVVVQVDNKRKATKRKKSKVGSVDMPSVDATGEKDHGYSENAAKQDTVSTKREIGHEPSMQQMSNIMYQGDANVIENPSGDGKKKKKRRCHSESLKAMNPSQDLTKSSGFVTNESSIQCIDATPIDAKQTTPGIIEGETVTEHKKLSETLDVAATNVVDEVLADLISKDSLSKDLDEDLLPGQTHLGSNQNGVEVPESNAVKVGSITAALPPKYPAAVHPASPVSSPGQKKSKGKKSKVLPTMTDSSHQSSGVPEEDANRELKDSDSLRFADKTSDPEDIVTGNVVVQVDNKRKATKRKKSKVGSVDMPSVDATGEKDHGYSENAAKQDTVSTKREIGHVPSMQQMSNIVYQGDANVIENPSGDGKKKKKRRCHSESLKAMNPSQDLTKSSGFVANESSIQCIDATPIDAKQTTPGIIEGETVTEHKKLSETLEVAATNVIDEVLADLRSKDSLSKDLDEDLLPGQTHLGSNQNGVEVPESNAVKVGSVTAALPPKYPAGVHSASPVSSPGQKKSKGKKSKVLPTMTDSSHQSSGVPEEDANKELKDSDSLRFADKTSDPEDIVTGNVVAQADDKRKATKRQRKKGSVKQVLDTLDLKEANDTEENLVQGGSVVDTPLSTVGKVEQQGRSSETPKIQETNSSTHGLDSFADKDSQDEYVTDMIGTHDNENAAGTPTLHIVQKDAMALKSANPNSQKERKTSSNSELQSQDCALDHGFSADLVNSRTEKGNTVFHPANDRINFLDHFSCSNLNDDPSIAAESKQNNEDESSREVKNKKKKRKQRTDSIEPNDILESLPSEKASLIGHFDTSKAIMPFVATENMNRENENVNNGKEKKRKGKANMEVPTAERDNPNCDNQGTDICTQESLISVVQNQRTGQDNGKESNSKVTQNASIMLHEPEDATWNPTPEKNLHQSADDQSKLLTEKDHAHTSKEVRKFTSQTKPHDKIRKPDGSTIKGKVAPNPKPVSNLVKDFSMSPLASSNSIEGTPQSANRHRVAVRKVSSKRYEETSGNSKKASRKVGSGAIFNDSISEGSGDELDTKTVMEGSPDSSSTSADSGISSSAYDESEVPDDDGTVSLSQKSLKGGLDIGSILRGSRSYQKARKKQAELLDDDTIVPDSQPTDGLWG